MPSDADFAAVLEGLRRSAEAGRLSHAYLIVGAPRGNALALAEALLQFLFCRGKIKPCGECADCRHVRLHQHADVLWLEPESKSRRIVVGDGDTPGLRDLVHFISLSPLTGPWKAGVVVGADRMTEQAANAFLKILEEPPPASLLLLLTDAPQFLLPTIVSRCQRIILSAPVEEHQPWRVAVLELLRQGPPARPLEVLLGSARLEALLAEIEQAIEQEEAEKRRTWEETTGGKMEAEVFEARVRARLLLERADILRLMLRWYRDVLLLTCGAEDQLLHLPEEAAILRRQAANLPPPQALGLVRAVEEIDRALGRNLKEAPAYVSAFLSRRRTAWTT
jgi:DNA polymerase III subunit delta'